MVEGEAIRVGSGALPQKPAAHDSFSSVSQAAQKPVVQSVVVVGGDRKPMMQSQPQTKITTTVSMAKPATSSTTVSSTKTTTTTVRPAVVAQPVASTPFRMEPKITTQQLEPQIQERRLWNLNNVIIAFIIGAVLVIAEFIAVPSFGMQTTGAIILALILLVIYAIILFFLLEPRILREVKYTQVRTVETPFERVVEKPVYKTVEKIVEKPVEKIVDRPVIRTIEKPVYRTVDRPVVRTVTRNVVRYKMKPRVKLNIPHYNFTGSTETKVYHTTNCRLGKLIKRKYALHANTEDFFRRRKFRPCEVCILKNKKI